MREMTYQDMITLGRKLRAYAPVGSVGPLTIENRPDGWIGFNLLWNRPRDREHWPIAQNDNEEGQ